jgi:hypothetical protein
MYLQHRGQAADGWGDTSLLGKYRIASGNAEAGNFAVSAIASRAIATGSHSNGALTGSYTTAVAGTYARGHFDVIGSVGGSLPTGQIWMEVENNATFYKGGIHDGRMQNFATPAVFCVVRKKAWKAFHPWFIVWTAGCSWPRRAFIPTTTTWSRN